MKVSRSVLLLGGIFLLAEFISILVGYSVLGNLFFFMCITCFITSMVATLLEYNSFLIGMIEKYQELTKKLISDLKKYEEKKSTA